MMIRLAMTLWGIVIVTVIVLVVDRDVIGDVKKTILGVIARLAMRCKPLPFVSLLVAETQNPPHSMQT